MTTTPTKLHPFPKVVATPVTTARAHFKKEEQAQSTITQCYRNEAERDSKPSPLFSFNSSSEYTDFEPKKKPKKKSANSPMKTTTTTVKIKTRVQPRSVAVDTLGKVDGGNVKLNKCTKAKDHGRKKRTEGAAEICGSETLGAQKWLP